jgi:hypothetical protein
LSFFISLAALYDELFTNQMLIDLMDVTVIIFKILSIARMQMPGKTLLDRWIFFTSFNGKLAFYSFLHILKNA